MVDYPLYMRVVVDDVEVRAVKGPCPVVSHRWEHAYPIYVQGELRGYLVYENTSYNQFGRYMHWTLHNLIPQNADLPNGGTIKLAEDRYGVGRKELLAMVPGFIAKGDMPTNTEVKGLVEAAQTFNEERRRLDAIKRVEDDKLRARVLADQKERRETMHEAMISLHNRSDLTNLERVGLAEALARLGVRLPATEET